MFITTYDKETQAAVDELDRNIKARSNYLTKSIFGSKAIATLLKDEVLNQLYRIKSEVIATATSSTCYEVRGEPWLSEPVAVAIPMGEWCKTPDGGACVQTKNVPIAEFDSKTVVIKHATRLGKSEINARYGKTLMMNELGIPVGKTSVCMNDYAHNFSKAAERARLREAMVNDQFNNRNPWADLGIATQAAVDAMKKFGEVAKHAGVCDEDIEQHLNLLTQEVLK